MNVARYCILTGLVFFAACASEKKLGINMPEGFSAARQKELKQQFAEGKKAYLSHCAGCHNKKINGQDLIPDISFEQADTYRVRFTNNQHKSALSTETITEKELDRIVIFFKYKKESGVAAFDKNGSVQH